MQSSKVVHIKEVRAHISQMQGESIRVLGRIKEADPNSSFALISFASCDLLIDTSLIGVLDKHNSKDLFQFIGDMEEYSEDMPSTPFIQNYFRPMNGQTLQRRNKVYLNARIMRNMEGLDIALFDKALTARRVFDAQRVHLSF
ncbi:telomere-capping, CST complex subunit-domain-containing protein [Obelidium mucronatum]|nr:telomere-capping, CST complex subunit-domain-containing protein [Obelidium mucronatum]